MKLYGTEKVRRVSDVKLYNMLRTTGVLVLAALVMLLVVFEVL